MFEQLERFMKILTYYRHDNRLKINCAETLLLGKLSPRDNGACRHHGNYADSMVSV